MSNCNNILENIPDDPEKVKLLIQGYLSKIKLLEATNNDLIKQIDHLKSTHSRQELNEKYKELESKYNTLLVKYPESISLKEEQLLPTTEFIEDGPYKYPELPFLDLPNHHSGCNIICCKFLPNDYHYIISGGTDKKLILTHLYSKDSKIVYDKNEILLSAPLLSVDVEPNGCKTIIASSMDGKIYIVDIIDDEEKRNKKMIIRRTIANDNNKYVTCIKFNHDGKLFASGSYNKICNIYDLENDKPVKSFYFNNNVESIEWFMKDEKYYLIISVRDSQCLYYIDLLSDFKATEVSINSNNDTYVSFTILDMKVSYNQKYLGTINDKGTIIIYQLFTNNILWRLYNDVCDIYFNPKLCWDRDGKYVLCNVQNENSIVVWSLSSKTVLSTIHSHSLTVRDVSLQYFEDQLFLLTCSYDKSMKIYTIN